MHHSKHADKFSLHKTAAAPLPGNIRWYGELIPVVLRAGCGARELMSTKTSNLLRFGDKYYHFLAPQVRQVGSVSPQL